MCAALYLGPFPPSRHLTLILYATTPLGFRDSVCEQCDPDVKSDGWSIKPGYFHDRDFALDIDGGMGSPAARGGSCKGCPTSANLADEVPAWLPDEQSRANKYGLLFVANTGGCQVLPDVPMPASPNSNLNAALVNPTSGTIADVGARLTSAIAKIKGATKANQGAEISAAWYSANPATCTKVANSCPAVVGEACMHSERCAHTPAAHADAMAPLFGTDLHYGHSNARIKVIQALAILHKDITTGTTTANRAQLEMDVIAHMLIPMYQGLVHAAHKMDHPTTAAAGLADFAAYWAIIKHEVAFNAADQARLDTLAADSNNKATNNFCTVKALLYRNLPTGSKLQYMHDWTPCPNGAPILPCPGASETAHANEVTGAQHLKASVVDQAVSVHLTEADLGSYKYGPVCSVAYETYGHTTYTSCGVTHTLTGGVPQRVVAMTQGVTEMMLAMGLEDKMVGTAYLDDAIWPRYETAYKAIDVLSATYPNEAQITTVNADFLLSNFRSAFRQKGNSQGIFSPATVGVNCSGEGSDIWASGSNTNLTVADGCELGAAAPDPCSTCRPQLHAVGIGTWLDPTSCEDKALRPQGGATEETVYAAIRQIGKIFNVAGVAEQLVSEIRNDFIIASNLVKDLGKPLRTVWLDCVTCCKENELFIGAGSGSPNVIMESSGLTNIFANVDSSFSCQNISTILAADPDLVVVVDAAWDPALGKIDFMHNHTDFCGARFVKNADYISIPFSASSLGPRNGAAALDMASAAVHVTTGDKTVDFQSGVTFFDPNLLMSHTASLKCPLLPENVQYANAPPPSSSDELPGWGIALVAVFGVLFFACFVCALTMFLRERAGKPIFQNLEEPKKESTAPKTNDVKVSFQA